ncbi:MAG: NCS2 family permease [Opitutales bacterium]|nr:NCS2 family permease [Opitutales bacterium]
MNKSAFHGYLNKVFRLETHSTTVSREIVAGFTTFAAMSYILAVNPMILGATGMDPAGLITVTALAACVGSLLMAGLTNYPLALAPGMGLNAFFAFTVVSGMGLPWEAALGLVFWNGILFLLLSVSGVRGKIADAIPGCLKLGIQCGIGFFIAFIGFKNGGVIEAREATFVGLGDFQEAGPWLVLGGLIVMAAWHIRKFPAAILGGILLITLVGLFLPAGAGMVTARPEGLIGRPTGIGETFLALDFGYAFRHFGEIYPILIALLLVDMFDTVGTLIGVSRRAGLLTQEGRLPKIGRALSADASATILGALFGTSTTTAYVESAAGVEAGGRTGLTAVVVGLLFLLALFFTPLILVIPPEATAPALILVGVFMAQGLRYLAYDDLTEFLPALVTILAMPLTFSISNGIALGFLSYALLKVATGQTRQVHWLVYLLAAVFLLHFLFFAE